MLLGLHITSVSTTISTLLVCLFCLLCVIDDKDWLMSSDYSFCLLGPGPSQAHALFYYRPFACAACISARVPFMPPIFFQVAPDFTQWWLHLESTPWSRPTRLGQIPPPCLYATMPSTYDSCSLPLIFWWFSLTALSFYLHCPVQGPLAPCGFLH